MPELPRSTVHHSRSPTISKKTIRPGMLYDIHPARWNRDDFKIICNPIGKLLPADSYPVADRPLDRIPTIINTITNPCGITLTDLRQISLHPPGHFINATTPPQAHPAQPGKLLAPLK